MPVEQGAGRREAAGRPAAVALRRARNRLGPEPQPASEPHRRQSGDPCAQRVAGHTDEPAGAVVDQRLQHVHQAAGPRPGSRGDVCGCLRRGGGLDRPLAPGLLQGRARTRLCCRLAASARRRLAVGLGRAARLRRLGDVVVQLRVAAQQRARDAEHAGVGQAAHERLRVACDVCQHVVGGLGPPHNQHDGAQAWVEDDGEGRPGEPRPRRPPERNDRRRFQLRCARELRRRLGIDCPREGAHPKVHAGVRLLDDARRVQGRDGGRQAQQRRHGGVGLAAPTAVNLPQCPRHDDAGACPGGAVLGGS
mmetsp:Transcript_8438/g.33350  ORF Transcript_8438/g.33350 Transcript_8438/m.33350 type:complete len:307 (-) Transcript_8438:362-1282(-)